jgi:hypothetical protein
MEFKLSVGLVPIGSNDSSGRRWQMDPIYSAENTKAGYDCDAIRRAVKEA